MIFPRPRVREKSARPSLSETETTEQNHATGIRIECRTRAVSRRRGVIAAAIGPVSSVERPGVVQDADRIVAAENDELRIDGIKRNAGVLPFAQRGRAELTPV